MEKISAGSQRVVHLLQVSSGDTGWDVFSLDYHVEGPIATVTHTFTYTSQHIVYVLFWSLKICCVLFPSCLQGIVWATTCGCLTSCGGPRGWSTRWPTSGRDRCVTPSSSKPCLVQKHTRQTLSLHMKVYPAQFFLGEKVQPNKACYCSLCNLRLIKPFFVLPCRVVRRAAPVSHPGLGDGPLHPPDAVLHHLWGQTISCAVPVTSIKSSDDRREVIHRVRLILI